MRVTRIFGDYRSLETALVQQYMQKFHLVTVKGMEKRQKFEKSLKTYVLKKI